MNTARHHTEWLSLLEISGPFLSMPVLLRVFPQGLDALDADLNRVLRPAYDEWVDSQRGLRPDPAIHTQWVRFVLANVLDMPLLDVMSTTPRARVGLVTGTALPPFLRVPFKEHDEVFHPDYALLSQED